MEALVILTKAISYDGWDLRRTRWRKNEFRLRK
jgi:hypothetical protein